MANSTDPFGKQTFGGQTSIPGGTSTTAAPTSTAAAMPWKSYGEYFKDQPLAADYSNYHSSYLPGETQAQKWGPGGDPYRFSEEYNQYKTTLPQQYQDLINYGISPEQVQSGAVTGIMGSSGITPIQMPATTPGGESPGVYGVGSGSTNSLSSDVLSKMWR
jgi:hypothetical protein